MRKILTLIMLLALAIPTWAGEQTITISRNDGEFSSSNGVYTATKGGVTMDISGGMNNPNFLLLKHEKEISFRSANFAIKEIIFHCLDDFEEGNLDVFYWGPTTMNVITIKNGSNSTTPGKYTASGYDGHWVSSFNGSFSSTFDGETREHTSYANGYPAGNTLTFKSMGKPIRFSSIDIIIEKEEGDIYELVTKNSQVTQNVNYLLVGRADATTLTGRALSVNNSDSQNPATGNIKSTPVGLLDNGFRVKANGDVQFIHLGTTGDSNYPWYLRANDSQSIKTGTSRTSGTNYNNGYQLILQTNPSATGTGRYFFFTSININGNDDSPNFEHDAVIKYYASNPSNVAGNDYSNYQIKHNNDNNQFRNLQISGNSSIRQKVFLYKPAQKYEITYEVQPGDSYGAISLRDGVLVETSNNTTTYTSQELETVSFLVTPANGYKIANLVIQAGNITIAPQGTTQTTSGTLYTFVMPASDVHIVATFEEVTYHNVYTVVNPNVNYGNIFLTEGYVVQQDQVKSYDGEHIVFNVVANPKDPENADSELYDLYSVTVTYTATGEEIPYTYADGNYSFTMPDAEVTITATFVYENGNPLYLLGTANGNETWLPYGPRFNYDPNTNGGQYYLDVYFKGTGNYGEQTGDANGYFSFVWKQGTTWDDINSTQENQQNVRGVPMNDQTLVDNSTNGYRLFYYRNGANESNSYKIAAGLYRIYVKSYGYDNDWMYITKYDTELSLTPMGGETSEAAVEVPQHQLVAMSGDLYSKIKAINPNEADGNFMYKATISGVTDPQTESAGASTTGIATLDVVNDGVTVTTLNGTNYLGWIHADKTAFYKVINTPLKWIERDGEVGKTYTVSDQLLGVWAHDGSLWCKDLGNISNVKTEPVEGQVDYLATTLKPIDNDSFGPMRLSDWDQSNWVELDFTGLDDAATLANAGVGQLIAAGSVTGDYVDDLNYRIKLDKNITLEGAQDYVPNTYSPVNFLESNLTASGVTVGGNNYYFLNPKIQEYAVVTFAVWDSDPDKQIFVVRDGLGFDGAFRLGTWQYNIDPDGTRIIGDLNADQNADNLYRFHMLVQRDSKDYGTPTKGIGKANQTASTVIKVQPIDLNVDSKLPTAINGVMCSAQVTGVEYVNLAGMRSSKPFEGVNIVVTRYSDGSSTTSKMVR